MEQSDKEPTVLQSRQACVGRVSAELEQSFRRKVPESLAPA